MNVVLEKLRKTEIANSLRGSLIGDILRYIKEAYIRDFSFIHINKTGGSSIEYAFSIPHRHDTAKEKRERLGRKRFSEKFKFTVVRNPFDRAVSHWKYRVERGVFSEDFSDWVEDKYLHENINRNEEKFFMPQVGWITDERGEVMVDYVGRFEKIEEDYNRIKKKIGRGGELPHLKSTERKEYKSYYNKESKRIVKNFFRRDIKKFGYNF